MDQDFDIHVSTVAFSAYNWLAGRVAPATAADILAGLQSVWDSRCTEAALQEALTELAARNRILVTDAGFMLRDPRRRVATSRDREDDPWSWRVSERPKTQSENLDSALLRVSP